MSCDDIGVSMAPFVRWPERCGEDTACKIQRQGMVSIKMCAGYLGSSRVVSALLQHTRPYSLSGPGLHRAIRSESHHATAAA